MSAASDFAERFREVVQHRPAAFRQDPNDSNKIKSASVTDDGQVRIDMGSYSLWLDAAEALRLAQWILDTFGPRKRR